MGGETTFLIGAVVALIGIGAWGIARWRTSRAGGGRRW
jgi:hypothetical protein